MLSMSIDCNLEMALDKLTQHNNPQTNLQNCIPKLENENSFRQLLNNSNFLTVHHGEIVNP